MGREVKRVPLDFDHPMEKVWPGFLNPHYKECPAGCGGGYSAAYRAVAEPINRLMWLRDAPPAVVQITTFLAGRAPRAPVGHDSSDAWAAIDKLAKLAGLPDKWDECPVCNGTGCDPDHYAAYEAWNPTEPPTGEGWQLWETTSEGSPMSPVFASAEELADWLTRTGASSFGMLTATREQWLAMIGAGSAPSAVADSQHGLRSGVEACEDAWSPTE